MPVPGAPCGAVDADERLEDLLLQVVGDSAARVVHAQEEPVRRVPQRRLTTFVSGGVCLSAFDTRLSTIRSSFAASTSATIASARELDARSPSSVLHRGDRPLHERRDVGRLERHVHEAVPEAVDVEQVGRAGARAAAPARRARSSSRALAASSGRCSSVSAKPRTEVSGVRSSCETAERMLSRTSSTRCRSVTSCAVPTSRSGARTNRRRRGLVRGRRARYRRRARCGAAPRTAVASRARARSGRARARDRPGGSVRGTSRT